MGWRQMERKCEEIMVKRTERGWAGHFIGGHQCFFRRNTLLEKGKKKIIVSTVGNYCPRGTGKRQKIGFNRYFETMAFYAKFDDPYWDADVNKQFSFISNWSLGKKAKDNDANNMHERVVDEITRKLEANGKKM